MGPLLSTACVCVLGGHTWQEQCVCVFARVGWGGVGGYVCAKGVGVRVSKGGVFETQTTDLLSAPGWSL